MQFNFRRPRFSNSTEQVLRRDTIREVATYDYGSIAAGAEEQQFIQVDGARVGDTVLVGFGAVPAAGLCFTAYVSGDDTVVLKAQNLSAGAVDAASMDYIVTVFKD